jgi:hypothetical protein
MLKLVTPSCWRNKTATDVKRKLIWSCWKINLLGCQSESGCWAAES